MDFVSHPWSKGIPDRHSSSLSMDFVVVVLSEDDLSFFVFYEGVSFVIGGVGILLVYCNS